jgi:hypothetical protein
MSSCLNLVERATLMITILSWFRMRDLICYLASSELKVFNVILLISRC